MESTSVRFVENSTRALADEGLQTAMKKARSGFVDKRRQAIEAAGNFDELRAAAREAREFGLKHIADHLTRFETSVQENGGTVHWAETGADLNRIILEICARNAASRVTKGKSMIGEETGLNQALEDAGLQVTETDLGEYIIQLAKEPPSHIIAPAVHKTRAQIDELFHRHHALGERSLAEIEAIVNEARQILRRYFLDADVGMTGANLLVAETGSAVLVTNEGNGDLTASLPRVQIVIASIDKIVATLEDATAILRVLGRSATGQAMTAYTSFFHGPRQDGDADGPEEFHVVLLDNGRSDLLGSEFAEILRCIRCGACLNHCPVYTSVGGHAYGWVYPGPMGAVLTPLLNGERQGVHLPEASTLCGRCEEVCPMEIPLPALLRKHRFHAQDRKIASPVWRKLIALHSWLSLHPRLYRYSTRFLKAGLSLARRLPFFRRAPGPLAGWTVARDLPVPPRKTFFEQWQSAVDPEQLH